MSDPDKNVIIPTFVPADEFWSAIFGAEPFIWPWWVAVKYGEGCDWETPGTVTLTIADPDDPEDSTTKTLTISDLVLAYSKAQEQYRLDHWSDMDSDSSDIVLQIAVQGEVVFA